MREYSNSFFDFINKYKSESPNVLRLKYHEKNHPDFSFSEAIDQIEARQKNNKKLKHLTQQSNFVFPATVCAEQATSSTITDFHKQLIPRGATVLDITGGLGSDSFSFATIASQVTTLERDQHYVDCLNHNAKILGVKNISIICIDSEQWLKCNKNSHFDVIFSDPHRRGTNNKREFGLADCEPNMLELTPKILSQGKVLLIKVSPMLDLKEIMRQLPQTEEIFVISEDGECKEILLKILKNADTNKITAVNINHSEVSTISIPPSEIGKNGRILPNQTKINEGYLYEPNTALMKLKCWEVLCKEFPTLYQLHTNSHLFFSTQEETNFPGKIFKIKQILKNKDLKELKGTKLNVISRNFPQNAQQLQQNLKLKSTDKDFLIATRLGSERGKPCMFLTTLL